MVEVRERPKERTSPRAQPARAGATNDAVPVLRKIGVIGAGQMGNGIAHVCALSGFHVLLNDVAADRITEGLATISGNLARQVSRQRISDEQRQAAIKRISPATSLDDLADCDLVIEAVYENMDLKKSIFEKLEVNGENRHPLYAELTAVPDAEGNAGDVQWNFEKFLVRLDGTVAARFRPRTTPDDPAVVAAIEANLPAGYFLG